MVVYVIYSKAIFPDNPVPIIGSYNISDTANLPTQILYEADFVFHFENGKTVYTKNRTGLRPGPQYSEEDIIMAKLGQLPNSNFPYLTHNAHAV